MKLSTKILGILLTAAFWITAFSIKPMVADAAYTYRIKICLGNNADAYFDVDAVDELEATYGEDNVDEDGDNLVISGFDYGDTISIDVDSLIKIAVDETTGTSKYYLSGLRISGDDAIVTTATLVDGYRNISANFTVTGDETYVVAYGVGSAIPYYVDYVDEDGNALIEEDTLYAARGEVILVPAKHIDGYYPDAYYRTASTGLKDDTTFTFVYKKYSSSVTTVESTTYSTTTEYGDPVYEYQYTRRNNGTSTDGSSNGDSTDGSTANGNGNNNGDADDTDSTDSTTTISDDETPQDVIDIDDEEVAKSGGEKERLVRNMVLGIIMAAIAAFTVLFTLFIAGRKRKREIVRVQNQNKEQK